MAYVNTQLSSFFILLIAGLVLGGFFDFYRVWRSRIRVNWLVTAVGDLFFWFLALVLMTPLIFWGTWLELRLYVWLALGFGMVFYFSVLSSICISVFLKFWRLVTWLPRQVGYWNRKIGLVFKKLTLGLRRLKQGKKV
ncbi:MAG TPA: spore cortex biosynthesis protein YabQ [Bacillota bacterium]|nr:spore cortex biosynthesis protein YabQ [Bacillota bacterium]